VSVAADAVPIVRLEHLNKKFGTHHAVRDVSLAIEAGEFFALLGPSGCGKTSLLRMIAGLDYPDSGRIFIGGEDVTDTPSYRRPVNMMFQSYALFPHMNVARNIGFGLVQEGMPKRDIEARVAELLRLVRLDGLEGRRPEQLSGGQRQRVALARALAKRPKILLLDEPLAALDQRLREETQFELKNIQAQLGTTFIVVTHDQREAMAMAQRMAVMQAGQFAQIGTPRNLYEMPVSRYVAEFIGGINLLEGKVAGRSHDCHQIVTPAGKIEVLATEPFIEGSTATFAIRPERMALLADLPLAAHELNVLSGELVGEAYLGEALLFRVLLPCGTEMKIVMPNNGLVPRIPERGSRVHFAFARDAGILLGR
jgi:putrescine transport system ATP-binding protein